MTEKIKCRDKDKYDAVCQALAESRYTFTPGDYASVYECIAIPPRAALSAFYVYVRGGARP